MTKFIDRYIFLLSLLTVPLIVIKLLGAVWLTWWGVFTPLLILLAWVVISIIAAGLAGAIDALVDINKK
jgi:hypothetical protein